MTGEGRLIAVLLMLTGIGVIGVFTATVVFLPTHHRRRTVARYIIDRFEENEWAVIEDEESRTFSVPRQWMPPEAREGDVLKVSQESPGDRRVLHVELDTAAREERLTDAANRRGRLPRAPRGDLKL